MCRHLPAVGKLFPLTYRCYQCGCNNGPHAAKLLQPLCDRVALRNHGDFAVEFAHPFIECPEITP